MLFIRWTGNGIYSPLIIAIGVFGVTSVTKALYGSTFYASHPSVFWLGLVLGGFLCWWTGVSMNNDEPEVLEDEQTGHRVILRKKHTLYSIQMQWWGVAAMVVGAILAVLGAPAPGWHSTPRTASNPPAAHDTPAPVTDPKAAPEPSAIPEPTAIPELKPAREPDPVPAATPAVSQIPPPPTASPEEMAIKLYPALAVAGSSFNTKFLALQKKYTAERPDYFRDPNWPLTLAKEVAESEK